MPSVCLQAGHQNIQSNCYANMRGGTGAPGEITWTPMVRGKVAVLLRARGFKVTEVDANVNCHANLLGPYDLTLAIHYQSDTGHSGFGVFVADASVDQVRSQSIHLAHSLAQMYALRTGLPNYSSPSLDLNTATWENPNTQFYYVWQTQLGPLALIECGEGAVGAPNHSLLYGKPDLIAGAIAEGVCKAFGVAYVAAPTAAQIAAAAAAVKAAAVAKAAADAAAKAKADAAAAAKNAIDAAAAAAKATADAAAAAKVTADATAQAAADKAAADAKAVADAAQAAKDVADAQAVMAAKAAQDAADAATRAADAEAIANAKIGGLLVRFFNWISRLLGGK